MTEFNHLDIFIKPKRFPINAITYSRELNLVAVGTQDGIVEIYDASQNLLFLTKIIASNTNAIDGLKFMNFKNEVKLIGISSDKLFEIDVCKNYIKQEVVMMSNCSRSIIQNNDNIVVGCDNGYIHVFEYMSEIKLVRTIRNAEESILSLAASHHINQTIFAGSMGRLYKINTQTNNSDFFDIEKEQNKTKTFIWCMEFVKKQLFTGDSRGVITIWNPQILGIMHAFKTHEKSILTMCVKNDCLYASGSDPQIVKLESSGDSWRETSRKFGIIGDVRSMCVSGDRLLSGGELGTVLMHNIGSEAEERVDKYMEIDGAIPATEIRYFAESDKSVVFAQIGKSVRIYEVDKKSHSGRRRLLRTIIPPKNHHFQAWSVSNCLKYFAYSTNKETFVLKLEYTTEGGSTAVDVKRFYAPEFTQARKGEGLSLVLPPSYLLKFITMGSRVHLLLVKSFVTNVKSDGFSNVLIYELMPESPKPTLKTTIIAKDENNFNAVHKLAVSKSGEQIAFSTLDGLLFLYSLKKLAMLKKVERTTVPNTNCTAKVICMTFNDKEDAVTAMYSSMRLVSFGAGLVSNKWNRIFNSNLPREWMTLMPRQIEFIGPNKLGVLAKRGLLVRVDMDKTPHVPRNVPLFQRRKNAARKSKQKSLNFQKGVHMRNMKKMEHLLQISMNKNDADAQKAAEKRAEKYKKRYERDQKIEVDDTTETCLQWKFTGRNTLAMSYVTNNKLVSVSEEERDNSDLTIRKKLFKM